MPRNLLTVEEIRTLIKLQRRVFAFIKEVMDEDPVGRKMKYPQIPSILTESLAIHLLRSGRILKGELDGRVFEFGGRVADVVAAHESRVSKIEIKATGPKAFQYFSDKDVNADYIIWIHFGEFFHIKENAPIQIYIARSPNRFFTERQKIILSKFRSVVTDLQEITLDLKTI
jgi:hypothetical protein